MTSFHNTLFFRKMIPEAYKQWLLYTLLLLGVLGAGWLAKQAASPLREVRTNIYSSDAFAENVVVTLMDKKGKPHAELHSPKIVHYSLHDTAVLTEPHFILYSEKENPWHTTSLRGKATHGIEKVELWERVKLHQEPGPKNKDLTITTEYLIVYPHKKFAETPEAITLKEPNTVVNAIGMRAYLDTKRVELLTHTRGIYEKNIPSIS